MAEILKQRINDIEQCLRIRSLPDSERYAYTVGCNDGFPNVISMRTVHGQILFGIKQGLVAITGKTDATCHMVLHGLGNLYPLFDLQVNMSQYGERAKAFERFNMELDSTQQLKASYIYLPRAETKMVTMEGLRYLIDHQELKIPKTTVFPLNREKGEQLYSALLARKTKSEWITELYVAKAALDIYLARAPVPSTAAQPAAAPVPSSVAQPAVAPVPSTAAQPAAASALDPFAEREFEDLFERGSAMQVDDTGGYPTLLGKDEEDMDAYDAGSSSYAKVIVRPSPVRAPFSDMEFDDSMFSDDEGWTLYEGSVVAPGTFEPADGSGY